MKYIIWGAAESARSIHKNIMETHEVLAFVDNDVRKVGKTLCDLPIISPNNLSGLVFDRIAIVSLSSSEAIKKQITDLGLSGECIDLSWVTTQVNARINFVKDFAKIVYSKNMNGSVAEVGVFQGEFAKNINKYFYDRKLYLFDTFEGFDSRDVEVEKENNYSNANVGELNMTSEDLVMQKMQNPEYCQIYKGYFPDSAYGIDDLFCFVNLDLDLYNPTIAGLHFFWDKLVEGGIILVHDYFSDSYIGVNKAVDEFLNSHKAVSIPAGDGISIAVVKAL